MTNKKENGYYTYIRDFIPGKLPGNLVAPQKDLNTVIIGILNLTDDQLTELKNQAYKIPTSFQLKFCSKTQDNEIKPLSGFKNFNWNDVKDVVICSMPPSTSHTDENRVLLVTLILK